MSQTSHNVEDCKLPRNLSNADFSGDSTTSTSISIGSSEPVSDMAGVLDCKHNTYGNKRMLSQRVSQKAICNMQYIEFLYTVFANIIQLVHKHTQHIYVCTCIYIYNIYIFKYIGLHIYVYQLCKYDGVYGK